MGQVNTDFIIGLDLEMAQPSGRIIEIGLAVGDVSTKRLVERKSFFVNPNEQLSDMIVKLTSITQKDVDAAKPLAKVYVEDVLPYLAQFQYKRQPIVWGSGDCRVLKQQLYEQNCQADWCFGWSEMNVKNLVQAILQSQNRSTQGGLAKSLTKLGLKFDGTKHRAHDDAANTILLYYKLLEKFSGIIIP